MRTKQICLIILSVHISCALVSCKEKSKGSSAAAGTAIEADTPGETVSESEAADAQAAAEAVEEIAPELQLRSAEIHEAVSSKLEKLHGLERNRTWSNTVADLPENWLIATPETYWGKTLDQVPVNGDCEAKDPDCDAQFLRKTCTTDADCVASRTSCLPLASSVTIEGQAPRTMCLMPNDKLMDRMYKVVTSAEESVEMTSLSSPDGRFREALINAMAYLSHKAKVPQVRLLFSGDNANSVNILVPAKVALDSLMAEVEKRGGVKDKPAVNLAWLSSSRLSWNHSKIVIADQKRVMQGGHNFWNVDYLSNTPVFDVSMEMTGAAAAAAQAYVNLLWAEAGKVGVGIDLGYTTNISTHPGSFNRLPSPVIPVPEEPVGATKVLQIGRMGAFGDNAADDGIIGLIEASQKTLFLSQQDLFNGVPLKPLPSFALNALVDALLRGVHVKIVQSTPSGNFVGYGLIDPDIAMREILKEAEAQAKPRNIRPDEGLSMRATLCSRLEYTTFSYSESVSKWSDGTNVNNHAKMIIADEASFYIGSQNFYPANLQEFGVIVSDAGRTKQLLENYWNPLWEATAKRKRACS